MARSASLALVCILLGTAFTKDTTRSKRQMNVYYMCGSYPNSYVSQYPCAGSGNGCGYNNCNGLSTVGIIPTSFYNPYNNCNSGCNNVNCNQYNGIWMNGQYIAYSYGSNMYSSCASSCCNNYNNFNNGIINTNGWNNGYNPYNTISSIGSGVTVSGTPIGSGVTVNGIGGGIGLNTITATCGGNEPSNGYCNNGFCSDGYVCTQGNACCRCSIGSSNGRCSAAVPCAAGYSCTQNGFCCASSPWQGAATLQSCINNSCPANFNCGDGNLCYPVGK